MRYARPLCRPPVRSHARPGSASTERSGCGGMKSNQPTVVTARLGGSAAGRCDDVADEPEVQAAIRAQRDGYGVLDLEQVGQEQVAELVEGEARVAAGVTEVVVVADQLRGPGPAAVE